MRRTFILLLVLTVGHVLLISAQVQSKSGLPVLESAAFGTFAHMQQFTAGIADAVRGIFSRWAVLRGVADENERLKLRLSVLEGQVQEQQAMLGEKNALEDALALQRRVGMPTLAARVTAGSPAPGALTVMIDRGTADGVQPDMAVIAAKGVVGRVINQPTPHAAQVQLLIGKLAGAGVTVERAGAGIALERTGTGGIAVGGAGDPPLRLEYVPNSADLRAGDRVMTSGQDGIYPPGFLVGTIERAERGAVYWTVAVRPAVDFTHIDIVLVVLAKPGP